MRYLIAASAVVLCSISAFAQKDAAGPAMAIMGQECLMNHPITSKLDMTMAVAPKGAPGTAGAQSPAPEPVTVKMNGEVDRDSDGRTRMIMRMAVPGLDNPLAMTIIMDPIEKRLITADDNKKTYGVTVLDFNGQCSQHVPTVTDFEAAFKAAEMKVTRLDDKQIAGYPAVGYSVELPDKMFPKTAGVTGKPELTMWLDVDDNLPLELKMAMHSDKVDMDMRMRFTDVHRVETPVAAFGVPEGYTKMEAQPAADSGPSHNQ